jgi:hypothetical protein
MLCQLPTKSVDYGQCRQKHLEDDEYIYGVIVIFGSLPEILCRNLDGGGLIFSTCVRDVLGSNLVKDIHYTGSGYLRCVPHSSQANLLKSSLKQARTIPIASYPADVLLSYRSTLYTQRR